MKTLAFQGAFGAYAELAGLSYFNKKIKTVAVSGFEEVFNAVLKGKTDFGIIPIENSLAGSIHQNYDLLLKHPVWICGEIKLRVKHNLIVNKGAELKDIRRVYSHPQGLAQCRNFIKNHLKKAEEFAFGDTAGAVRHIKEKRYLDGAAIASSNAAERYGMKILKSGIEDDEQNYTRFVILSRKPIKPSVKAKTSIVFALKNVPGALWKSLSVFAIQDLDLHKIESRPIPGSPWQYIFYLDVSGNVFDPAIKKAVDHLGEITTYLKVLGSYPYGK
ncbi:MAG: prephenate dehydratase [Fibrobacteres bacterium]|nr:prephenate dehydratase [Fibrobacterota bacterium]